MQAKCTHCGKSYTKRAPNQLYCCKNCGNRARDERYFPDRTIKNLSRSHIGAVSELDICSHYLKKGYQVFRNVAATGPADIIIWNPETNEVHMIDVKTHVSNNDPQKIIEKSNPNKNVKVVAYNYNTRKCDERALENVTHL